MNNDEMMVNLVAKGSMVAAANLIRTKHTHLLGKEELVCQALKVTMKSKLPELPELQAEWKQMLASGLGDAWLKEAVNVQCREIAVAAVGGCKPDTGVKL